MAKPKPIMLPAGQKDLTRRALLGGLSFSTAAVAVPSFAMAENIDSSHAFAADHHPHPVLALPFVRDTTAAERALGADPRTFWSVQPSGNFGSDCTVGAGYAEAALDYMVAANAPEILSWAVFDMMRLPRMRSGVEVGFLSAFGRLALQSHAAGLSARAGGAA
ncbi:MAG: hypothetical protein II336_02370 [Loktanella sp.]|nr:hypothetical protein [Loktanella sp.]